MPLLYCVMLYVVLVIAGCFELKRLRMLGFNCKVNTNYIGGDIEIGSNLNLILTNAHS